MNVKIRNEIQALIRIQERNNNGGELREFICARKVDGCGEKTYGLCGTYRAGYRNAPLQPCGVYGSSRQ